MEPSPPRANPARQRLAAIAVATALTATVGLAGASSAFASPTTRSSATSAVHDHRASNRHDKVVAKKKNTTVTVRMFQFQTKTLTVRPGTKVVWKNRDDILHTVTSGTARSSGLGLYDASPDGAFDGRTDGAGESFRFTFDRPGTYAYFCDRHRHMTATIVVK